ncbi:MAG: substrate-binding periplasmic protein [Desulfohalobiaceae bacterium]
MLLLVPLSTGAGELTILTEDMPPYNYVENGTLTGSSVAVTREILNRLGRNETIAEVPWARAYNRGLSEPNVLLLTTVRTKEREHLFKWVGPLSTTRMALYARRDSDISISSLEEARQVGSIGTYRKDIKEQFLEKHGFTNLDSATDPATNLKKLMAGRVDLWISFDLEVAEQALKAGVDPSELKEVFVLDVIEVYFAFSRQTPDTLVAQWHSTFEAMQADGTLYALSSRWLPDANIPGADRLPEAAPCHSRLQIFTENAPPSSYLENGRLKGLAVDIVREMKRRLGDSCPIHLVPWARGYELAMTRPNVALFATSRLPRRENDFQWVGPLYSQTWGFYARKGSSISLSNLEEAKSVRRIGTYRQDAKEQFLMDRGFSNLTSANNNMVNPRHLLSGHIDLWVASDLKMPYFARQAGIDPLKIELVLPFRRVENYLAFSRETPQRVVAEWQRVLEEMKDDGGYDRIFSNWAPLEWARKD